MSQRALTLGGLAVAGGVGYYLYTAGGDPKVAQKQFEADASKASAKIKSEVPGRTKEAEKKGEELATIAGQKFDRAASQVDKMTDKAADYKNRTGKELNQVVDNFDKTVEKKAAEAKSGISSWFGGK